MDILLNRELLYLGGLALLLPALLVLAVRRASAARMALFALLWLYLLFVASRTLFPIPIRVDALTTPFDRELFLQRVNLTPFFQDGVRMTRAVFYNVFFNVLLTVPVGLGLPLLLRSRWWHFLWIGPLVGLSIEAAQFICILLVRYPYRVLDINDVLANTLGAWIGFFLYLLLVGLARLTARWRRVRAG